MESTYSFVIRNIIVIIIMIILFSIAIVNIMVRTQLRAYIYLPGFECERKQKKEQASPKANKSAFRCELNAVNMKFIVIFPTWIQI